MSFVQWDCRCCPASLIRQETNPPSPRMAAALWIQCREKRGWRRRGRARPALRYTQGDNEKQPEQGGLAACLISSSGMAVKQLRFAEEGAFLAWLCKSYGWWAPKWWSPSPQAHVSCGTPGTSLTCWGTGRSLGHGGLGWQNTSYWCELGFSPNWGQQRGLWGRKGAQPLPSVCALPKAPSSN